MIFKVRRAGVGRGPGSWPVAALLILIAVVPAAGVLWFMIEAMENDRSATRRLVADWPLRELTFLRNDLRYDWDRRIEALGSSRRGQNPSEVFAAIVEAGLADSAVIVAPDGTPLYPTTVSSTESETRPRSDRWQRASTLEFRDGDCRAAAAVYAEIARNADGAEEAGRARLAEARCLERSGAREAALSVLTVELMSEAYRGARTESGRLLQPTALLRAAELLAGGDRERLTGTIDRLVRMLRDYGPGDLPAAQRRFLMRRCKSLAPDRAVLPTFDAEELAAAYLEAHGEPAGSSSGSLLATRVWFAAHGLEGGPFLRPCRLDGTWELVLADAGIVALYRQDTIVAAPAALEEAPILLPGAAIRILPPGGQSAVAADLTVQPAEPPLAGWQLVYEPGDLEQRLRSGEFLQGRRLLYLWIGVLVVAAIVALSALMARLVGRQLKLTRLKNDLVATVSHELKTPLASIRVLVDTLLDGRTHDPATIREYLELIARENARLGRLIENFLTFSRMERDKRSFDRVPVDPARIARDALASVREKFESAGFRVDVEIAPDLPEVPGDASALETMLLNLLDNAYKYSQEDRRVALRVLERDGDVCFEVEDHGIGMTARATRKVFDRFYQVDRSLSREMGGCGLGLSIVRFVADAHQGRVEVESRPGAGSRFTVRLPAVRAADTEPPG